jgi:hypothetical protein
VREASAISGLPVGFLKDAIKSGNLKALHIPRGPYSTIRINRHTLEYWEPEELLQVRHPDYARDEQGNRIN